MLALCDCYSAIAASHAEFSDPGFRRLCISLLGLNQRNTFSGIDTVILLRGFWPTRACRALTENAQNLVSLPGPGVSARPRFDLRRHSKFSLHRADRGTGTALKFAAQVRTLS